MGFSISERYRLELHWDKVTYTDDQTAILDNCYFSGPVLAQVMELEQEDSIRMDFVNQYYIFVEKFYIAELSWKGVNHLSDKIMLKEVVFKNNNLVAVPKLKNSDYIVIDTKKHVDEEHLYNLVYTSYLLRGDNTFYDFRSMK